MFFPLKTRLEMQKALEQDSTVYDYDAVYDEIQNQRQEKNQKILHGTDKRVIFILQSCSMVFLLKLHEVASIPAISHSRGLYVD